MSLPRGTQLGPHEVESPLGFGRMGEVCKARDTRLNRSGGVESRRASIGRNTMNEIDREEALSLLIKNCGLTESEAKACLRNPLVTMLIIPILERLNQIESRLNQK